MKTSFQRSFRAARVLVALALGASASAVALAADTAPTGRGIVTMTRGMRIFSVAENALIDAMKSKDSAALDKLVSETFEQRSQAEPGTPLPREDWLAQAAADAAGSGAQAVQQMAVHDHGDLAVVSFLWVRGAPRGNAFVVDVWKRKSGDDFMLDTRYLSAVPAAAGKKPSRPAPAVDTKK